MIGSLAFLEFRLFDLWGKYEHNHCYVCSKRLPVKRICDSLLQDKPPHHNKCAFLLEEAKENRKIIEK